MAFCAYCGKSLADGEVCTCQGAKESTPQFKPESQAQPTAKAPSDKAQANKLVKYGIVAVIAIVAVVIVVKIISGIAGSYKKPIENICKQINKGTKFNYTSLITAPLPDGDKAIADLFAEIAADNVEDAEYEIKEDFEDLNDRFDKWKVSFEFVDSSKLEKSTIKSITKEYDDIWDNYLDSFVDRVDNADDSMVDYIAGRYGADSEDYLDYLEEIADYVDGYATADISKGYKVRGYFVFTGDGKEYKTDKVTLYVIKINGEWTVSSSKDSSSFYFDNSNISFLNTYLNTNLETKLKSYSYCY